MNQTNHDIFAEQYVEEYRKLCVSHPWFSVETKMKMAKAQAVEYLYLKLREDLPIEIKVWPEDFKS